jgi:hypothetical protein
MKAGDMRPIGRDTQGVKLMDLAEGDRLVSVATLLELEDDPAKSESPVDPGSGPGGTEAPPSEEAGSGGEEAGS